MEPAGHLGEEASVDADEKDKGRLSAAEGPTDGHPPEPEWASWSDEALLDLRICDLDLRIEGSPIAPRIEELNAELEARGLRVRPHFWFSNDWFTPDGVPGVAIPFYMAHPRLMRLELSQVLEVEGGTADWCMRILRHETGHAIDNAYRLRRRRRRQRLFGSSSEEYPEYYTPKPYSRSFVYHLEPWYGQSHPDEDFAETFAVWLTPGLDWRQRYADWPALKKLEYVDRLMHEIVGKPPLVTTKRRVEPLRRMRKTLRKHYEEKRARYGADVPSVYDRELRRLFSDKPEHAHNLRAARFVQRIRRDVRRTVAQWTREYQYTINQVLDEIIERCRQLDLHLMTPEEQAKIDFTILLTVQLMNYLHSGRHRVWL